MLARPWTRGKEGSFLTVKEPESTGRGLIGRFLQVRTSPVSQSEGGEGGVGRGREEGYEPGGTLHKTSV